MSHYELYYFIKVQQAEKFRQEGNYREANRHMNEANIALIQAQLIQRQQSKGA